MKWELDLAKVYVAWMLSVDILYNTLRVGSLGVTPH